MSRLYPCAYCTEDGYCKKYSDDEVTSWCVQGPCKDEKPSNADRFRSMTDEELAWELARICRMPFYKDDSEIDEYEVDCWAKWLKQEAET